MADKILLKGIFNGSGDPTGLAEFTTSDTIGFLMVEQVFLH